MGYHGKMSSADRRCNQERWTSDEVRVIVGTIAFGLGINKAMVRAVVHLALPKSIEQYYQESGRAGRDVQSADCILLWQKKDAGLLGFFANQITDSAERERAWERYRIIRAFVESSRCRHRQICTHFGELPKWETCNACDVCGSVAEWMVIPSSTPQAGHRRTRVKPLAGSGEALKTPGVFAAVPSVTGAQGGDELTEYLREWRRDTAKRQGVPAFVVLHDSSLEEICQRRPKFFAELRQISGIGDRKAELYGQQILDALERFRGGARSSITLKKTPKPADETTRLLAEGRTLEEIAQLRGRQLSTIVSAVAKLVEAGDVQFRVDWVGKEKQSVIEAACARAGLQALKPLKDILPPEITYDEIRLVVARLRREQSVSQADVPA